MKSTMRILLDARRRWPYVAVPTLILGLLAICYVDSVLAPMDLLGSLLPRSVWLVPRNAEAGTSPQQDPDLLPQEVVELLDLEKAGDVDGHLVQDLDSKQQVVYTIETQLQQDAESILDKADLLAGALVLVDSRTGRILVMADTGTALTPEGEEHEGDGGAPPMSMAVEAPAASVFKVVTSSALVETAGVSPSDKTCYWGGGQKLKLANLVDDPDRDKACASLSWALGKSINSVFAKLADRHLDSQSLTQMGHSFGFDEQLPLDYPIAPAPSPMEIPEDRLEFARTAAGFWHVHMSALHGAFIAQSIAQQGAMLHPILVDEVRDADGQKWWTGKPRWLRRTVQKETARKVTSMMVNTTTKGTARKYFKDPKGNPYLPGITVAGKTGTLTRQKPFRAYTWFVGFAPADDPEVAVATLAVNKPKWKVKAAAMARDILRAYFKKHPSSGAKGN